MLSPEMLIRTSPWRQQQSTLGSGQVDGCNPVVRCTSLGAVLGAGVPLHRAQQFGGEGLDSGSSLSSPQALPHQQAGFCGTGRGRGWDLTEPPTRWFHGPPRPALPVPALLHTSSHCVTLSPEGLLELGRVGRGL